MIESLLARLLHVANSSPPHTRRKEFYALKDRLLKRYAVRGGDEIQEIKKECWGYNNDHGCHKTTLCKCRGTGVFDHFFVRLEVYRWRGYKFHRPVERRCRPTAAPDIVGCVKHRDRGNWPAEAVLWLCLLAGEWNLLRRLLHVSCRPGAACWMAGLQIQRATFWLHMRRVRRCSSCDSWSWGSRGCPHRCRPCYRAIWARAVNAEGEDDGIPF